MFNDKKLKDVSDAVSKVMESSVKEELKGDQHKIDANKNNKVDAHDFKLLRAGKKVAKEEVEQVDELSKATLKSYVKKSKKKEDEILDKGINTDDEKESDRLIDKSHRIRDHRAGAKMRIKGYYEPKQPKQRPYNTESVETVEEGIEDKLEAARAKAKAAGKPMKGPEKKAKSNVTKVAGKAYGGAAQKDEPEEDEDDTPKKAGKKGVFKRRYNTRAGREAKAGIYKEQFSGLLDAYINGGLKGIMEELEFVEVEETVNEEVDNETFTKEVEAQKEKAEGKGKKAEVAAASVQAVTKEEVEQVEERTLTEPEMNKREEVVKSMKKNLAGFKERYGSRGKEVLYATATKIAKKD